MTRAHALSENSLSQLILAECLDETGFATDYEAMDIGRQKKGEVLEIPAFRLLEPLSISIERSVERKIFLPMLSERKKVLRDSMEIIFV